MALREVEEETGVTGLKLKKRKVGETYHTLRRIWKAYFKNIALVLYYLPGKPGTGTTNRGEYNGSQVDSHKEPVANTYPSIKDIRVSVLMSLKTNMNELFFKQMKDYQTGFFNMATVNRLTQTSFLYRKEF